MVVVVGGTRSSELPAADCPLLPWLVDHTVRVCFIVAITVVRLHGL